MQIKAVVVCVDSNGAPDLVGIVVRCSKKSYNNGEHYRKAEQAADIAGYGGPFFVIDENDPGFRAINWEKIKPE